MEFSNLRFLFVLVLVVPGLGLGSEEGGLRTCDRAIMVAAGESYTVALKSDGTVWTWGDNWYGQLGNGTMAGSSTPVQVVGPEGSGFLSDITAISAGADYGLAIRSDGTVWAWGDNWYGQLGNGATADSPIPVQVVGPEGTGYLTDIIAITGGEAHTVALKSDGTVWAWGCNWDGQLGDGMTTDSPTPVQVVSSDGSGFLTDVIAVAAGYHHTVALKSDGTVWSWGGNYSGQLGDGTTANSSIPVQVVDSGGTGFLSDVIAIAAGSYHTVALKSDGTVWTWGANVHGQLGDGGTADTTSPVQVVGPEGNGVLSDVIAIAAGGSHTVALKSDGTVWAWGLNNFGQLGDGTIADRCVPVQVVGPEGSGCLTDVVAIAAGYYHTVAIRSDGTVLAWGYNAYGQLGDGTTTNSFVPVQTLFPADGIPTQRLQSTQFRLFPNPASDFIEITAESNCLFILYDLSGKILKTENFLENERIFLRDLPHGVYLYRIASQNVETSGKLLIVH